MKKFILFFAAFLLILSSTLYAQQGQMKSVQLTIGTGDKSGGLYPIGISIGKILNINSKIHKLTPDVIATEGAVYNIDKVLSGELMLGIVENDVQYRAYKGLGEWENAPQYDLRSIISLAPEIMQLIVSEQSKIKTLMDLQNKNINIGIIGENTYYSIYTTQILEQLDAGTVYLKKGDIVSAGVVNNNQTLGEVLKNFFYQLTGNSAYTITAKHSGVVVVDGQ